MEVKQNKKDKDKIKDITPVDPAKPKDPKDPFSEQPKDDDEDFTWDTSDIKDDNGTIPVDSFMKKHILNLMARGSKPIKNKNLRIVML